MLPWSLLAPDPTRNRTTSKCPFWAAMNRGVAPVSVVPWSLLAPDSTRNWTTSRCPSWAAMTRGVAPSSVLPWSLLAPDSTRDRTTSRYPFSAATKRGVAPLSVRPWSLLAPHSTRSRTTSRCANAAAMKRGVAPSSVVPWSLSAPASISKDTHLRLSWRAATHKGVIVVSATSKLGFRGWFKCCSRSLSSFSSHATMTPWSCSLSGSWNSRMTSCTTWRVKFWSSIKVWSSSSAQLSWRTRSRKRGMQSFFAKHCFNALTEASANSSCSKTATDSPVTAESTSSMRLLQEKAPQARNNSEFWISLICWNTSNQKWLPEKHASSEQQKQQQHHQQQHPVPAIQTFIELVFWCSSGYATPKTSVNYKHDRTDEFGMWNVVRREFDTFSGSNSKSITVL